MNQAVPEDVDEPNELPVVPRDDPPEAVPVDLFDPVPLGLIENARLERFCVEFVQFNVVELVAPLARDRHHGVSLIPSPASPRSADNVPCAYTREGTKEASRARARGRFEPPGLDDLASRRSCPEVASADAHG
jgi:hypothetical protein